jgi:RNA ligase
VTAHIADLFPIPLLEEMEAEGYVRIVKHPTQPLWIHNYTHRAQYDRAWNECTTQCRGLITDWAGRVVARPWPKFFNYGEIADETRELLMDGAALSGGLDLDAPCQVTDKMDGSLGILYPYAVGGWAIATRGSFTSDQAVKGTELLQRAVETGAIDLTRISPELTYLFEIVYPENRVVLDYEGYEGLVLLGTVITESGRSLGVHCPGWRGAVTQTFSASTLREALALEPRENAEGVVVRYIDGPMVKLKQEDYVALHRIVTGLNERAVWQMAADGITFEEMVEPLPEEFRPWVRDVLTGLILEATRVQQRAVDTFIDLEHTTTSRKQFAEYAAESPEIRPYLFLLLDGKDDQVWPAIWRTLRPRGGSKPREYSEATA